MIIKHFHHVLNPWLQTINISEISDINSLLFFDGFPSHLNIDLLNDLGGYGMLILLRMTNTSHVTNVEDLVTFGIAKIDFKILNKV